VEFRQRGAASDVMQRTRVAHSDRVRRADQDAFFI
jgi:hypothetical protein